MAATGGRLDKLRVDQVGSLVTPHELRVASTRAAMGEITDAELHALEDQAIRRVLDRQKQIGMPIATDGEFRRRNFQDSFGNAVSGFDTPNKWRDPKEWIDPNNPLHRTEPNYEAVGPAIATRRAAIAPLALKRNVIAEEYQAASSMTDLPVKVSLIGPDRIGQRFAWEKSRDIYPDMEAFLADVVKIERQMIEATIKAGCRYIHIDAPGLTAYVDEVSLERMRARGEDPTENLDRAIRAENALIEGFEGVTFGLHLCRGNPRGVDASGKVQPQWHREGMLDSIAERLFGQLKHQRLLLEYDSERAGSFEPLRFICKDTVAVLGVVTTKSEQVEDVDAMKRRVEAASQYLPLEQLAVSPQCGFSSGMDAVQLPEEIQWRKLEVVVKTAEAIWGHA